MTKPTHYEYAVMSAIAYDATMPQVIDKLDTSQYQGCDIPYAPGFLSRGLRNIEQIISIQNKHYTNLKQRNWLILPFFKKEQIRLVKENKRREAEYTIQQLSATLFIHEENKQLVMAIRGTPPSLDSCKYNFEVDLEILQRKLGEKTLAYLSQVISFVVALVRLRDQKFPDFTISFTGHSLGGFAAKIAAAYLANPQINLPLWIKLSNARPNDCQAVVFDALGGDFIGIPLNLGDNSNNTISYVATPNLANTCCRHRAAIRLLFDPATYPATRTVNVTAQIGPHQSITEILTNDALQQFFFSHSIHTLLNFFNPESGLPRMYGDVVSFPRATNILKEMNMLEVPVNLALQTRGKSLGSAFFQAVVPLLVNSFQQVTHGNPFTLHHSYEHAVQLDRIVITDNMPDQILRNGLSNQPIITFRGSSIEIQRLQATATAQNNYFTTARPRP